MVPHCVGCGRPAGECPGCARPLDPPRFCPECGRRLAVTVTPTGWEGRCRDHGRLRPDPAARGEPAGGG
ncbi:MAG: biotin synthase auxiliary protein BsaP [Acidimicrobiales bacterium]